MLSDCKDDEQAMRAALKSLGCRLKPVADKPVPNPVSAISLAVSQKCNLACSYCYAEQGGFGQPQRSMSEEVAIGAIERLIRDVGTGNRVNIAFMGGEPLMNRRVLKSATQHAVKFATDHHVDVGFSITTNGTLLTPEDGDFFEEHGFAVTLSVDGLPSEHDHARPDKQGNGTFNRLMDRVRPLLRQQRRMQVSVRSTVTPSSGSLVEFLQNMIDRGFHSVGVSPLLSSPTGNGEMNNRSLKRMLRQMIECGDEFQRAVAARRRYPFLNIVNAMQEIHRGSQRALPCGAGDSYVGVGAEGDYYACHRFVNDDERWMGDLQSGVSETARTQWTSNRHVHMQEPCRSCWARYLCGGGCHHEVIHRGRSACEFIRGWLAYCLDAYAKLSAHSPWYFGVAD
ncbi:radical SAM/SPASM domain-containing protein [Planctomycetes bacterium TBK1r]